MSGGGGMMGGGMGMGKMMGGGMGMGGAGMGMGGAGMGGIGKMISNILKNSNPFIILYSSSSNKLLFVIFTCSLSSFWTDYKNYFIIIILIQF